MQEETLSINFLDFILDTNLAPTYKKLIGDYWVLWYLKSNSYSIIDTTFNSLLDLYLQSATINDFKTSIADSANFLDTEIISKTIHNYLNDCNISIKPSLKKHVNFDISNRNIVKQYKIKDKTIQIYYDTESVLKMIHPALAHLTSDSQCHINTVFDIYLKDYQLYLFKDELLITYVSKKEYHLIQGKFIMQLLCTIHNKQENDWIGTFHGSTLTDGNSSILFIGESGKGKSTLCTILTANGFNLLADDVSPMLSKNKCIYHNPLAISIKEGAFNTLQPLINNFSALPIVQFNKTKGLIKYVPCIDPKKNYYPCDAIILVNYQNTVETKLEKTSIKIALETLIKDSWLSPNPTNAKQFLNWLQNINIYQLTYSDANSVKDQISQLFQYYKS